MQPTVSDQQRGKKGDREEGEEKRSRGARKEARAGGSEAAQSSLQLARWSLDWPAASARMTAFPRLPHVVSSAAACCVCLFGGAAVPVD